MRAQCTDVLIFAARGGLGARELACQRNKIVIS